MRSIRRECQRKLCGSAPAVPDAMAGRSRAARASSSAYASSLAAASLQDLGLVHATDVAGGFRAWAAAGFPVRQRIDPAP